MVHLFSSWRELSPDSLLPGSRGWWFWWFTHHWLWTRPLSLHNLTALQPLICKIETLNMAPAWEGLLWGWHEVICRKLWTGARHLADIIQVLTTLLLCSGETLYALAPGYPLTCVPLCFLSELSAILHSQIVFPPPPSVLISLFTNQALSSKFRSHVYHCSM